MWSRSNNEFRNYFATWENRDWKSCQKFPTSMQRKWHRTSHCYWLTKQKPCWRLTEVRGTLIINTLTPISEETEQLLKDFENDLKLSDSNPISLCPQVTVNGDDLVNLITNLDVKVNHMIYFFHSGSRELECQMKNSREFIGIPSSFEIPSLETQIVLSFVTA